MQNTRLNSTIAITAGKLGGWLRNPWRRLSVVIIGLLFGNFLGTAVATTAGQRAELDIFVAAILVALIELINRVVYRARPAAPQARLPGSTIAPLFIEILNALKIGLTYSLFVEAFKLGS